MNEVYKVRFAKLTVRYNLHKFYGTKSAKFLIKQIMSLIDHVQSYLAFYYSR